jgi:hypothetical protein
MTPTSIPTLERSRAAESMLAALSTDVSDYRALDEAALLELNRVLAAAEVSLGAVRAVVAGEIAHRSRGALGSEGLAQRSGFRTVEQFIKISTGSTARDAATSLKAGILLSEIADEGLIDELTGEVAQPTQPWLRPVATALAAGTLSIAASESIRNGLGLPNSAVTTETLSGAAEQLCAEAAAGVDPDRLFRRARELRDDLDLGGVKIREEEKRQLRGFTLFARPNGTGRGTWEMDPETFVQAKDLYDRMTSPKNGGVRFVAGDQAGSGNSASANPMLTDSTLADSILADSILADERTIAQLASDGFLQLLRQGADADTSFMLGTGAPVIRITATRKAIDRGAGVGGGAGFGAGLGAGFGAGLGRLEGAADPVSIETVQRMLCTGKSISVIFDELGNAVESGSAGEPGGPLEMSQPGQSGQSATDAEPGREQRLFSKRQREILAVKFGGCMDPNCERPPSFCEAHHIQHWRRDRGKTLVNNGILLCRYHHLKYHNEGWEIRRDELSPSNLSPSDFGQYWLIPPVSRDVEQTPILMPSKSAAMRDLWRERDAG